MIIISLLLLGSLLPHLSFTASVKVGIVNGDKLWPSHSRPYMVSVQKKGKHVCSGFLISDQFAMTAAHCKTKGKLTVVAGTDNLIRRKEHVRIRVMSYYKHKPDLMVLELNERVKLNKKIKTIPIPTGQEKIKVGTMCSVAGWGELTHYGPIRLNLQEANVMIMSDEVCQRQWGKKYNASQMMGIQEVLWFVATLQ
ncbi:complement factor D-like isoform X2 [Triplophysa rosa]|uniref:complement factor D-like isoform X2 n=1 Tax=Triplophysa rosa TaxID=992332 RepID=UPI002545E631|nr:complement factor D-like isoform X2 [Triplophysa rosa]